MSKVGDVCELDQRRLTLNERELFERKTKPRHVFIPIGDINSDFYLNITNADISV